MVMVTLPPWSPRQWVNQLVTLYHGTDDRSAASILDVGVRSATFRVNRDFGPGFYTTTVERQAFTWAWLRSQGIPGPQPAVIQFDVDRDRVGQLQNLWFVRGSFDAEDYWSLVFQCRQGGNHRPLGATPWYDVVIGPVALDWIQRLQMPDGDQVSFHTDA